MKSSRVGFLSILLPTLAQALSVLSPTYANVTSCKLPGTSASLTEGFNGPRNDFVPSLGNLRGYVIFVDFPDAPANETTTAARDFFWPAASYWYGNASYGKLKFDVKADLSRWWRMPHNSTSYHFDRGITDQEHQQYIQDALNAVGTNTSFGQFHDVLYVVAPRSAPNITFSPEYDGALKAKDGTVLQRTVTVGQDAYVKYGPKLINHETGHAMGLPDLYPYARPPGTTTQWTGGFDLMSWIIGASPDYLAWHKWKLGWLDDNQFDCVSTTGSSNHVITPIETANGIKGVIVKLNATAAVVAEVRTKQGLNKDACAEGVLVYTVNTATNSGEGPIWIYDAKPNSGGCATDEKNDSPFTLEEGSNIFKTPRADQANDLGVKITVVSKSGNNYMVMVVKEK